MSPHEAPAAVTGVILAGGEARRMGGNDKGLVEVGGRPLIAWTLEAFRSQVDAILISANRNLDRYARFGNPVISDTLAGFQGPLAGMHTAMRAAATPLVATVPCDVPFLPPDLVARLRAALEAAGAEIAVAHNGERVQPVFALLRCTLADSLEQYLALGERKIDRWFARHTTATADFSDCPNTFLNVNSPGDAARVEARLRERHAARTH
jgi:molybdopterin-guanine dinucleotide biosynthesis protein A